MAKKDKSRAAYYNYYTNIYIDEAQDLSTIQLLMLKFIKRKGGRYIFVLDENQAIYSFAGGNAKSCALIPKLYAPIKEFDLPINYRCPTSHLAKVNRDFDIPIQPRPDAPIGSIKTIDKEEIKKYVHAGDLVISRKNKWLSDVILDLAIHGIPIYMEDNDKKDISPLEPLSSVSEKYFNASIIAASFSSGQMVGFLGLV